MPWRLVKSPKRAAVHGEGGIKPYVHSGTIHSRTVHNKTAPSRSVHSEAVPSRSVHSEAVPSRRDSCTFERDAGNAVEAARSSHGKSSGCLRVLFTATLVTLFTLTLCRPLKRPQEERRRLEGLFTANLFTAPQWMPLRRLEAAPGIVATA
eukprot:scaffold1667_cov98-Isochrysis_galbana.AAC.3